MKEKWTKDLQKKMSNYEVLTIPEGLWEDIDAAIGEIPSKTEITCLEETGNTCKESIKCFNRNCKWYFYTH